MKRVTRQQLAQEPPEPSRTEFILDRIEAYDAGTVSKRQIGFIGLSNMYLFAAYAYYELNQPLMSDRKYDRLCRYLADNFGRLQQAGVWHIGSVITLDNLRAATFLKAKYPEAVKRIVRELLELRARRRN